MKKIPLFIFALIIVFSAFSVSALENNAIAITKINKDAAEGDCVIYTPSFGDTITSSTGNGEHGFKNAYVICAENSGMPNQYLVTAIHSSDGQAKNVAIAQNGIVIACYYNDTQKTALTPLMASASIGSRIELTDIDIDGDKIGSNPYITISASATGSTGKESTNVSGAGKQTSSSSSVSEVSASTDATRNLNGLEEVPQTGSTSVLFYLITLGASAAALIALKRKTV